VARALPLIYNILYNINTQNTGVAEAALSRRRNNFLLAADRAQEREVVEVKNRCEPTLKSEKPAVA
jgi:hypothetical protein